MQAVGSSIRHVAGQNIIQEEPPLARGRSTYVGPTIHTEQTGQVFAEPVLHFQAAFLPTIHFNLGEGLLRS